MPTYTLCGVLGLSVHAYLKKYVKEEIECSIVEYFFKRNKKASLATLGAFIGVLLPALQAIDPITGFTINAAIGFFSLGYTCDSAFNNE
jgi:divalent metal cation (Fe/Co/Zn/Cd) transporter